MSHLPANAINPYAGSHPVTADPREQQAAQRAAAASIEEFPYYTERFGDRGRLFGTSDGAWLVTLCDYDTEVVREQVLWLGSVLASRGMPRWLLERHLELLHAELVRLVPERASDYERLREGAMLLRSLRQERIGEEDSRALGAAFAARAEAPWARRLPRMGEILVAAVADEAAGLPGVVDRVREWVADPARFPGDWIAAVDATLEAARTAVRSAGEGAP